MVVAAGLGRTHAGPNAIAVRTPSQRGIAAGAFQRASPTGGGGYGIPLNISSPSSATPCSLPAGGFATGPCSAVIGAVACRFRWAHESDATASHTAAILH